MDKGFIMAGRYEPLKQVIVYRKSMLDQRAELALLMIEKWGMVQGYPDGEDSAGRARIGLMPIGKLIDRAFECADAAYLEIERRGWSMEIPAPTIEKDR